MWFMYFIQFFFLTIVSSSFCANSVQSFNSNDTLFPTAVVPIASDSDSLGPGSYQQVGPRYRVVLPHPPLISSVYTFHQWKYNQEYNRPPSTFDSTVAMLDHGTDENPVVWVKDGGLRGFTMKTIEGSNVYAFQSVPFAQPPVGKLRFQAPLKNSPWVGIKDAIEETPTCLQTDFIRQYKLVGTEDCLYLNVYTPKVPKAGQPSDLLPVMVFIHGGGFFFGSSNLYGPSYLLDENVILVSMNYRLGPLGFLSTGDAVTGNSGLKDQTLALQWVKDNIRAFGGNPDKVTIFGESAGAGSVHLHMLSPLSQGLFHAAISQSGCALCNWSIIENAAEIGRAYAKSFNCSTKDSKLMVDCLRDIDGATLVKAQHQFLKWSIYPIVIFGPSIEPKVKGAFMSDCPSLRVKRGQMAKVPWLTGYNANEGGLNIATILLNPAETQVLNQNWDAFGPILMELDGRPNSVQLVRQIRDYYLGNRAIALDTSKNTSSMFGDRFLNICGMKSIMYHAEISSQPVYAYHFNYVGNYGIVQLIGQKPQEWGPAHLDELIYLLNNTLYYPDLKLTDEEYQVSRIVTNMWANFAKTGKPLLTINTKIETDVWKPVDGRNIRVLDISLNPKMIDNPFHNRVNFWNSLGIGET